MFVNRTSPCRAPSRGSRCESTARQRSLQRQRANTTLIANIEKTLSERGSNALAARCVRLALAHVVTLLTHGVAEALAALRVFHSKLFLMWTMWTNDGGGHFVVIGILMSLFRLIFYCVYSYLMSIKIKAKREIPVPVLENFKLIQNHRDTAVWHIDYPLYFCFQLDESFLKN